MTLTIQEITALLKAAKWMALADGKMSSSEKTTIQCFLQSFGIAKGSQKSIEVEKTANLMNDGIAMQILSKMSEERKKYACSLLVEIMLSDCEVDEVRFETWSKISSFANLPTMTIDDALNFKLEHSYINHIDETSVIPHSTQEKMVEFSECEKLAELVINEASNHRIEKAYEYGLQIFMLLKSNPTQFAEIKNFTIVAAALSITLDGDHFDDDFDSAIWAIGTAYYFISKSIAEQSYQTLLLRNSRMYIIYEYPQVLYRIFAHMDGKNDLYDFLPGIFRNAAIMEYDHKMEGMIMADGLMIGLQINQMSMCKIFNDIYSKYKKATPAEKIISIGNEYHKKLYNYISNNIAKGICKF